MKVIFVFIGLMFSAITGIGQGIIFENASWQSILLKAKEENRLIFVECSTVWCKPCKWMERNIFPLKDIGDYYNLHFINVRMDMESKEGIKLGKKYKVNSYPTYLFLDSDGNLIHEDGGLKEKENFIVLGKIALDPMSNLKAMDKIYLQGNRSRTFIQKYILMLGSAKQKEEQKKVFKSYFNSINKMDLLNKMDFEVIISAVDPSDYEFLFLLKNHQAYKELVGGENFDKKIYSKLVFKFSLMARHETLDKIVSEAAIYKQYYTPAVQKAEDMAIIRWYYNHKKVEQLIDASIKYINLYTEGDVPTIVYFINLVLDVPDDIEQGNIYKRALTFVQGAIKKYPDNVQLTNVYEQLLSKSEKSK